MATQDSTLIKGCLVQQARDNGKCWDCLHMVMVHAGLSRVFHAPVWFAIAIMQTRF